MAFNVVLVVLARLVVRRNDAAQGSGRLVLQRRHVSTCLTNNSPIVSMFFVFPMYSSHHLENESP